MGARNKVGIKRQLCCEFCGEYLIYFSKKRIRRFCSHECFRLAHKDSEIGKARKLYFDQLRRARNRQIPWNFTFETWYQLWLDSGHWKERGLKKGQYVMSRKGDKGPYLKRNVRIVKTEINLEERKMPRGVSVSTNKLTEKDVLVIRNSKGTQGNIGKKFGIDRRTIGRIQKREIWAWLE